jgi:hypothetical protein
LHRFQILKQHGLVHEVEVVTPAKVERFIRISFQRDHETVPQIPAVQGYQKRMDIVHANSRGLPMFALHAESNALICGEEINATFLMFTVKLSHLKALLLEHKRNEAPKLKQIERPHVRPAGRRVIQ